VICEHPQVLFPGKDYARHIMLISKLLGKPPAELTSKISSAATKSWVERSLPAGVNPTPFLPSALMHALLVDLHPSLLASTILNGGESESQWLEPR
jgi:hypothetical protein